MANTTNFGWETPDDTDLVKDGAAAMRTLGNSIDASFVDLKGGTTGQVLAKASNSDLDFTWATDASGISATIFDAKGDLIAATAADTAARLAVGTNGQVLQADSTTATGLKWATPTGSAMVFLNKTSFSAVASQTVDNVFSSTYDNYYIIVNITQSSANDVQYCWRTSAPADVTGNYYDNQAGYQSTAAALDFTASGATNGTLIRLSGGDGGMGSFTVTDVAAAAMTNLNGTANGVKSNNYFGAAVTSKHVVQTAYAGIKLSVPSGNMSGSITIYGMVKA